MSLGLTERPNQPAAAPPPLSSGIAASAEANPTAWQSTRRSSTGTALSSHQRAKHTPLIKGHSPFLS
ncbi:MAG: hypothetical protein KF762_02530 [Acidobacteria bacterium]|nr:hypothetical protein [Acidobacteriota bacterium]